VLAISEAMKAALLDFLASRPARQRLLANAIRLAEMATSADEKSSATLMKAMEKKIAKIEANMTGEKGDAIAGKMIQETLANSSTNSPGLLASILAD
jgi:hypothetical protein